MFDRWLSHVPLKVTAPLVLALPVVLAVGAIGGVAYWQGRTVAETLESRTVAQIHGRIADRLTQLLNNPVRWNRRVVDLIDQGALDTDNPRAWRGELFDQALSFDKTLAGVCWADARDGRTAWVFRYEGMSFHDWGIRDALTDWELREFRLNRLGEPSDVIPPKVSEYDPRDRPWFTMAADAGVALWGEPYVWISEGQETSSLGLPYMTPVYDDSGDLLGVVDVELGLGELSSFMSRLQVGKTGLAFLMDRDGQMVSSSVDAALANENNERLAATRSDDARIARVAAWLAREARVQIDRANDDASTAGPATVEEPGFPGETDEMAQADEAATDIEATVKAWPQTFDGRVELSTGPALVRLTRFDHERGLEWLIVTVVPEIDFTEGVEEARERGLTIATAALLLTLLLGLAVAAWMIRPLMRVAQHVRGIGEGDLETRLELQHSPEVSALSESINDMAAGLRDRLQMRKSLAMAMEVQQHLLPSATPKLQGLDIAGHSIYCDETGGDYYDYLHVQGDEDEGVSVVVGDVMGHGIAAAMLMATARGVLHSRSRQPGSLADLLDHLNELLTEVTAGERFMTMLMVNLQAQTRTLRWASAGHDPPFIYNPDTDTFMELSGGGLPLGIAEHEQYDEYCVEDLPPGTILMGSTDGMWESRNPQGEMHGKERLMEIIRTHRDRSARDIARAIHKGLARFRCEAPQDDDETYVVVKVTG